jgi:hypothetical protein
MYQVIFWMFVTALVGLCVRRIKWRPGLFALAICYVTFLVALLYYATQVFQQTATSVSEGWYLTSFTVVEAVLFTAGAQSLLGTRWYWGAIAAETCLLSLFVYTTAFVAMPYYSGITFHATNGSLRTYHPHFSDFGVMSHRLLRFHPSIPLIVPWIVLLTIAMCFCYMTASKCLSRSKE